MTDDFITLLFSLSSAADDDDDIEEEEVKQGVENFKLTLSVFQSP